MTFAKNPIIAGVIFLMLAGLSACTNLEPALSAAPIDAEVAQVTAQGTATTASANGQGHVYSGPSDCVRCKLEYVMYWSERKCGNFLDKMTAGQNLVNTSGDVLSTILSGLGAIFSPLTTAHIFSGASTIVSGSKTSVDTDFWAKQGVQDYTQAIQGTYYQQMADFYNQLAQGTVSEDKQSVNVPVSTSQQATYDLYGGILKVQAIHTECKLAAAGASIRKQLGGTQGSASNQTPGVGAPAPPGAPGAAVVPVPGTAPGAAAGAKLAVPGQAY